MSSRVLLAWFVYAMVSIKGERRMQREVLWSVWDKPGLEHLRLTIGDDEIIADGEIITTLFEDRPIRVDYWIQCDKDWQVREMRVSGDVGELIAVILRSDGKGHWTDEEGNPRPDLDGCIDIDIMATPFTNTLPIRRLEWDVGTSLELNMAYVKLPALEVVCAPQRYICLRPRGNDGLFRYESVSSGYTNELPVDMDGLVIDYPGIWRRVWPEKGE
jgi:hypothetical protein